MAEVQVAKRYSLHMPPSVAVDEERGITSFSSLLERLTGIGTGEMEPQLNLRAVFGPVGEEGGTEFQEDGGVTYKPWPTEEKSCPPRAVRQARQASSKGGRANKCAESRAAGIDTGESSHAQRRSPAAVPRPVRRDPAFHSNRGAISDLRRSTVSIRLNGEETALLRQRAVESGTSVSEYVRSCVVEAEQLRLQVKQIVADMRVQPERRKQEMKTESSQTIDEQSGRSGIWSQLLNHLTSILGLSNSAMRQPANPGLRFL